MVHIDYSLAGALTVSEDTAGGSVRVVPGAWPGPLCDALAEISTRQHAEACVKSLTERVDDTGECDFADLPLDSSKTGAAEVHMSAAYIE